MPDKPSAPERVQSAFRELASAASNLNFVSDELGKTVSELDDRLQELNLGIAAWVRITGDSDADGHYWSRDLGYAKVRDQWGVALRTVSGNERFDQESEEVWLFSGAPRWLRIEGIGKIPELLDQLTKQANDTTARIQKKTTEAKELAAAIRTAHAEAKAAAIKSARATPTPPTNLTAAVDSGHSTSEPASRK